MSETVFDKEILNQISPKQIVPLVAVLCSDKCPVTGKVFEVGSGWISSVRL